MAGLEGTDQCRVLIASSHPLFGEGLRSLIQGRHIQGVEIVGLVSTLEQALGALDALAPNLLILDDDDDDMRREAILAHFLTGEKKLRLVLLSLQRGNEAVIYERRRQPAAPLESWLQG